MKTIKAPCGLEYVKDYGDLDKPYLLLTKHHHYSKRYDKWITLELHMRADGATGAFDIASCGWWVHDKLCNKGEWNDGTRLTNWQCSMVLSDILWNEGRYFRSVGWLGATFIGGGGECKKNGMFKLKKGLN